jgi:hypothetical protein
MLLALVKPFRAAYDDECQTVSEAFQCGYAREPSVTNSIFNKNSGNITEVQHLSISLNSIMWITKYQYGPPVPCVQIHRSCALQVNYPCVKNVSKLLKLAQNQLKHGFQDTLVSLLATTNSSKLSLALFVAPEGEKYLILQLLLVP